MSPPRFRVDVYHAMNGLYGSVEVISPTSESAERFALRQFFRASGWTVQGVQRIEPTAEEVGKPREERGD